MKTNQFRAMVLALLMAVISLATVSAQAITVSGTVTDAKDGTPLVGWKIQCKLPPKTKRFCPLVLK